MVFYIGHLMEVLISPQRGICIGVRNPIATVSPLPLPTAEIVSVSFNVFHEYTSTMEDSFSLRVRPSN